MLSALTICLVALVPAIVCDYQVEMNLISYNNPMRRLQDGSCCDLESGGICLPQDTCDVRFTFSAQNFRTLVTFNRQTKVLGPYENTDMITFADCSTLTNNERNPLKFAIPTNQWNMGDELRILAVIADLDQNPTTGATVLQNILGSFPVARIFRPSAPNSTFSNTQTFNGANSLTLTFQYRVICTAGTCGSDCSQTTNCQPFSSCVPITCADSPCLNGGTCSPVQGCLFSCTCREGFTGATCGAVIVPRTPSVITSDVDRTNTHTATSTHMIPTSSSNSTLGNVPNCEVITAVVSSITIFILSSVIFLIIGFLIGYFVQRFKFTPKSPSPHKLKPLHNAAEPNYPAPEYAPIHAKATVEHQVIQGFGMKKNESYAPSSTNATERQDQAVDNAYCPVQINDYIHS